MELINFLRLFVITSLNDIPEALVAVGGGIFAIIEFCDWAKMTYGPEGPISEKTKRQMAGVLALALPLTAYFLLGFLEGVTYDINGVFLAVAFGFVAAKYMHDVFGRYTAKVTGAEAANARIEEAEHAANAPHEGTSI